MLAASWSKNSSVTSLPALVKAVFNLFLSIAKFAILKKSSSAVYKSSATFIPFFSPLLPRPNNFLPIDANGLSRSKFSPNLTSFNRFFISPNCTCEFTTPNFNSSLYLLLAASDLVPTCRGPKASA